MEKWSIPKQSKRLSSKDFLLMASMLWRAGPAVSYKDPEVWRNPILRLTPIQMRSC